MSLFRRIRGVATILFLLIASLLIHEEGHLLALRYNNLEVEYVSIGFPVKGVEATLWKDNNGTKYEVAPLLLGGATKPKDIQAFEDLRPTSKAVVYLAGIVFNLGLALASIFFYFLIKETRIKKISEILFLIRWTSFFNLVLGLANLLIVLPGLDGAKVLYLFLEPLTGNKTFWVELLIAVPMYFFVIEKLVPRLGKLYRF
jgi:membrane-associated protease RseP (regulator of RpoE activity)